MGQQVAIIGGGNAAIDSARTALRMGADVTVIYRRERKDMPAIQEETEAAEAEGAKFVFLATPHRIVGDDRGQRQGHRGGQNPPGRIRFLRPPPPRSHRGDPALQMRHRDPGGGRGRGPRFRAGPPACSIKENGTLEVDRYTLETSRSKFYAGGDLISGASNVSNAMGYGKKAARIIDQRLMGADRWDQDPCPEFEYNQTPPEQPSESPRHELTDCPPRSASKASQEAMLGLSAEEAMEEAGRCLRCDIKDHQHGQPVTGAGSSHSQANRLPAPASERLNPGH